MRVTERIVAWDALLVCLILIRLLGLHGQAQLGIVSSLWIDFDCVPHRACEYIYGSLSFVPLPNFPPWAAPILVRNTTGGQTTVFARNGSRTDITA